MIYFQIRRCYWTRRFFFFRSEFKVGKSLCWHSCCFCIIYTNWIVTMLGWVKCLIYRNPNCQSPLQDIKGWIRWWKKSCTIWKFGMYKTFSNNGITYLSLNWWVDPGFLVAINSRVLKGSVQGSIQPPLLSLLRSCLLQSHGHCLHCGWISVGCHGGQLWREGLLFQAAWKKVLDVLLWRRWAVQNLGGIFFQSRGFFFAGIAVGV